VSRHVARHRRRFDGDRVPLGLGSIVCTHGGQSSASCWIGEVCSVFVDGDTIYYVKQLGFQQVTSFSFTAKELRETVMTFEGPMCTVCKVPY
jgi:hypothetical protein